MKIKLSKSQWDGMGKQAKTIKMAMANEIIDIIVETVKQIIQSIMAGKVKSSKGLPEYDVMAKRIGEELVKEGYNVTDPYSFQQVKLPFEYIQQAIDEGLTQGNWEKLKSYSTQAGVARIMAPVMGEKTRNESAVELNTQKAKSFFGGDTSEQQQAQPVAAKSTKSIKLSKSQWEMLGKKAGWMKT